MKTEHAAVGSHFTYAFEKGWRAVCKLTEEGAWLQLEEAASQALVSGYAGVTVEMVRHDPEYANSGWLDKVAVVIENRNFTDVAVYLHDGIFYIIEKRLM
ncbi:hypothetical protein BH09PAT2_BH09PAT2_08080 [soil metagenome]